jgi:hypothetical protein
MPHFGTRHRVGRNDFHLHRRRSSQCDAQNHGLRIIRRGPIKVSRLVLPLCAARLPSGLCGHRPASEFRSAGACLTPQGWLLDEQLTGSTGDRSQAEADPPGAAQTASRVPERKPGVCWAIAQEPAEPVRLTEPPGRKSGFGLLTESGFNSGREHPCNQAAARAIPLTTGSVIICHSLGK